MKEFSWLVKNYDCNKNVIENYDVLKYRRDSLKKLARKYKTVEEFLDKLNMEMMSQYWSRAEYEVVLSKEDGRYYLTPWCGCSNPEDVKIDVTDDETFDWENFYAHVSDKYRNRNEIKIDIYDQLTFKWDEFVKYVLYALI